MPEACTVLIAPPNLIEALKPRAIDVEGTELLTFTDAEALHALDEITRRRPRIVTLERLFAATPRGAALINRIKADPLLNDAEIRVISPDAEYLRISPRRASPPVVIAPGPGVAAVAAEPVAAPPLDFKGTRRAPRFRMPEPLGILVDGNTAQLVDLSTIGAQVVLTTTVRPNQRVRMTLPDDTAQVRFNAVVAWASFEIPPNTGPRYRAGVEFADADGEAVGAFIERHKGN